MLPIVRFSFLHTAPTEAEAPANPSGHSYSGTIPCISDDWDRHLVTTILCVYWRKTARVVSLVHSNH